MFNFKNFFKALAYFGTGIVWLLIGAIIGSQLDKSYGEPFGMLGFLGYNVIMAAILVGFVTRGD